MPSSVLMRVDLPEPFAPSNPVKLPRFSASFTSDKTTWRSYPTATLSSVRMESSDASLR